MAASAAAHRRRARRRGGSRHGARFSGGGRSDSPPLRAARPAVACLSAASAGPCGAAEEFDGLEEHDEELAEIKKELEEKPPQLDRWGGWEHCLAGAFAGGTVELVMFPLDTLKTRQQAVVGTVEAAAATQPAKLKGMYRGSLSGMLGSAVADALYFGTYEPTKQALLRTLPEQFNFVAHTVAAASSSLLAAFLRAPSEVVKQRLQTGQFETPIRAVRSIVRHHGPSGLYAGLSPLLLRDVPFNAIEFGVYEQLKLVFARTYRRPPATHESSVIGAVAGAITGTVTTPFDVLKTRLMVAPLGGRYRNIMHATRTIVAEEGVGALFRGLGPRLLWISLGGSIFFGALESMELLLSRGDPFYTGPRNVSPAP